MLRSLIKLLLLKRFYATVPVTTSFFAQGVVERATHSRWFSWIALSSGTSTLSDVSSCREFLQRPTNPTEQLYSRDITKSTFRRTAIADPQYAELVDTHFKKYPVLSIDFKVNMLVSALKRGANQRQDVHGVTFEALLTSFDSMIAQTIQILTNPFDGIVDPAFIDWCRQLSDPQTLHITRSRALLLISVALQKLYNQAVVILIDEYDSPMHIAIENGYAPLVPCSLLFRFSGSLTSW
jgi:Predicted AAA-ATPase